MTPSTRTAALAAFAIATTVTLAFTLLGAAANTPNWGELTTPVLLVAGLAAFAIGTLAFTPTTRRRR